MEWTPEKIAVAQQADENAEKIEQYRLYDILYIKYSSRSRRKRGSYQGGKYNYFHAKKITKEYLSQFPAAVFVHDRHRNLVVQRIEIVKTLYDIYHLSLNMIGKLMNRDRASIRHLLEK